jgi:hypothetical protein
MLVVELLRRKRLAECTPSVALRHRPHPGRHLVEWLLALLAAFFGAMAPVSALTLLSLVFIWRCSSSSMKVSRLDAR